MGIMNTATYQQYTPATQELLSFIDKKIELLEKHCKKAPNEKNMLSKTKKRLSVLLVEDSLAIQIVHRAMLESLGCYVDLAKNGEEALQLSKGKYDIILMDVGLPDMSGIEVTARIRKREGKNKKNVPIFALTTHSEPRIHKQCLDAGMDKIAIKPISKDNLKKLVYQE